MLSTYFIALALLSSLFNIEASPLRTYSHSNSGGGLFDCMFNYGSNGCKGQRKLKEEEARQEQVETDNLFQLDKMNQDDTKFNLETTATLNGNQIQNTNALNGFRIDANNLLTSNTVEYGKKLGSDLNENLQVNHALQSKILNGGSNNAKNLVDFGVFSSQTPKQRTQTEYDEIFSSWGVL